MGRIRTLNTVAAALWGALLTGGCAAPAPRAVLSSAPPPPRFVSAVEIAGIESSPQLRSALAVFAGRPLTAALPADAAALVQVVLDWQEWRDVRIEPAPALRADGVLRVDVAALPPLPAEVPPDEYFDIPMPPPADPIPAPDGAGGARVETALDDSFSPWLASPARVLIDAADRRLYVKRADVVVSYAVAVGTPHTPTPAGDYWVEAITHKPTWYPPASIRRERAARGTPLPPFVPPGRGNPLGDWFVRLQNSIGIHGTNQPRSIGSAASHGCIRMHDRDVAELVALLHAGDRISIVGARAAAPAMLAAHGGSVRAAMQQ